MSDDLISRKAVLEIMREQYKKNSAIAKVNLAGGFIQMENLIKEQPTAYDVDKVIERLKEVEKETLLKTEEFYKDLNLSPQEIFAASNSELAMIGNCIDIVKSCGLE